MQETMKRVAAGALGLLMAGSTLLAPTFAAADLSSFANMKPSDTVIVVGANAMTQDVVGAINVGGALAQHGATATVTGGAVSAGAVPGGVGLATTNTKLYLKEALNKAKQTVTKDDLSVLASGSVKDDSGTSYTYDQYVAVGATATVNYGTSGNDLTTADAIVDMSGTTSNLPLYTARIVFNKDLDVNSTSKAAGKTIKLFGKDYTISSDPSVLSETNLVLYGGGEEVTVVPGTPTTVTLDGVSHTINLLGVSATAATLKIDGVSQDVTANGYVTVGSTSVFVKAIHAFTVPKDTGDVVLRLGSDKVTLKNNDYVRMGTNDDAVKGTWVTLTSGGADKISQIDIKVYAADSTTDFIKSGSSLTDPVFKSFKVSFGGFEPALTSSARETATLTTSGDNLATLTITDYKGVTKTLNIASNYYSSAAQIKAKLQDQNDYVYRVLENETAVLNDYVIINTGDFSHVLQVTNFDVGAAVTTKTVTLRDLFSNTDYKVNLAQVGSTNQYIGTKVIDGYTYSFDVPDNTANPLQVKVGDSIAGKTLFPTIKTQKGANVALLKPVTLTNATSYLLPGMTTASSYVNADGSTAVNITANNVIYEVTTASVLDKVVVGGAEIDLGNANNAGPAVLVVEEKDSASTKNVVLLPVSVSATPYKVEVDSASRFSDANAVKDQKTEDTKVTKSLDLYGTLVTRNTDGSGTVTVSYPDEQAVANAYVLEASASIPAAGTVSAGTGTVNQPSLAGGIAKVDSAITSADKTSKNVILVGGPAVNTLVAELAAANKTEDVNTWRSNLTGQYVIEAVENAFAEGKTAIVVAGYDYPQTQAASLKLATESLTGAKVTGA